MSNELDGEENIEDILTRFSPTPKKRGRPFSLDQQSLLNRRESLRFWLDGSWGKIGWKLQTAKALSDLRKAFRPLDTSNHHPINIFAQKTRRTANAASLRLRTKEASGLHEEVRATALDAQKREDAVNRVRSAFQQAKAKRDKKKFGKILDERLSVHKEAQANYEALLRKERALEQQMSEERAFFAQNELLRFLKSGRYAFTTAKLANAMAGLPDIGWRQSAKCCASSKPREQAGSIYWLVEFLSGAISESKGSNLPLTEQVRRKLETHGDRVGYRLQEAKRNWYHLRRAIEAATRVMRQHPGSLPFRITAQYQTYAQRKNAVELFREEEERLR
jgi:hypothetical protein